MDDLILPRLIKDLDKMCFNIFHVSSEMCFNSPKTLHDQGLVWRQLVKVFEYVLKRHEFGRILFYCTHRLDSWTNSMFSKGFIRKPDEAVLYEHHLDPCSPF